MNNIWFAVPSIRPAGGTCPAWKAAGYQVAVVRQGPAFPEADLTIPTDSYRGWAASINVLANAILDRDPSAQFIVSGGDDTLPDPNHDPDEIASQCVGHFGGTFGVMQPTGDKVLWPNSAIESFAGSPWIGADFCRRINGGKGPMREEFFHMYGDEALQCIAEKHRAFWQRADLIHKHLHYLRPGPSFTGVPDFMREPNSGEHWKKYGRIFQRLKAQGWPGSEPLSA